MKFVLLILIVCTVLASVFGRDPEVDGGFDWLQAAAPAGAAAKAPPHKRAAPAGAAPKAAPHKRAVESGKGFEAQYYGGR